MIPALLGNLGTSELLIIFLIILLLFGAARIPTLMRSLGKGIKSFKEGMNEVSSEITSEDSTEEKGK